MAPPPVPATVAAAFVRFMAAYPPRRPNPTAPARLKFAELVRSGVDAEELIAAAGRFAAELKAEGIRARFVPQARRWLHQREFEDYLTDAPATAAPAQPSPERPAHPLDWMRGHMTAAAWEAWISRVSVEGEPGSVVLVAPLSIIRDRIQQDYGHVIRRRLGAVTWRIERKD